MLPSVYCMSGKKAPKFMCTGQFSRESWRIQFQIIFYVYLFIHRNCHISILQVENINVFVYYKNKRNWNEIIIR